jgi:Zn-dependent protease
MPNLVSFVLLILSITFHEFAHAFVADNLGDPTPRSQGRLSLNPLAHIDPLGTLLLPLLSSLTGIPTIGWAKPVPIDPYNLAHPRRDEFLIALAGPTANFFLAIAAAFTYRFTGFYPLISLTIINISLAIFNLIPLWPLDGSKILLNLVPFELSYQLEPNLVRYSTPLLLVLVFLPFGGQNILSHIVSPITFALIRLLLPF